MPAALVATAGWSNPGASAVAWIGKLDVTAAAIALAGLALVVAVAAFALAWQLMRQNGRLLERLDALEGAPSGVPAPATPARPRHAERIVPSFSPT